MIFTYGTKVFTKFMGYYGKQEVCDHCQRIYKKSYVCYKTWAHFCEIPIIPVKTQYIKMCPICGKDYVLRKEQLKQEVTEINKDNYQNIIIYAKHILSNKPKQLLSIDNSYELWARDMNTNEDICIYTNVTKAFIKKEKQIRGFNKIDIFEIQ